MQRSTLWCSSLLATMLATYLPSVQGEFVWDDVPLLQGVKKLLNDGSILRAFVSPFWPLDEYTIESRVYYRPLSILSFALDSIVHHQNAAGYRLTNILFHLTNAILLFLLVRRAGAKPMTAALLTGVWALNPRLTESVAWISGRTDVLAATTSLLAIILWRPTRLRRAIVAALLLCGLLCKEVAVAALIGVMALEYTAAGATRGRRWLNIASFGAIGILYFVARARALSGHPFTAEGVTASQRPALVLDAIGRYVYMGLIPWQPQTQIGNVNDPSPVFMMLGAVLTLLLFTYGIRAARRGFGRPRADWLVLTVSFGLVLHIVPISVDVIAADRFLYLPLAALVLCVAGYKNLEKWPALAVFATILVSMVPITMARARQWGDPVDLWTSTCRQPSARTATSLLELGNLEMGAGNVERASRLYEHSREYLTSYGKYGDNVMSNLVIGTVYLGKYKDAEEQALELTRHRPHVPKYWYDLATIQVRRSEFELAYASLDRALRIMPDYEDALNVRRLMPYLERETQLLLAPRSTQDEKANAHAALGQVREAAQAWLVVLGSTESKPEAVRAGLAYLLEHGTHTEVEQALSSASHWGDEARALYGGLRDRLQKSERLRRTPLDAYGIRD